MPGKWRENPEIKALMARREREIRTVQVVVGALGGGIAGLVGGFHAEASGWVALAAGVAGAVAGGVAGYHAPFWKTAVDRPGSEDRWD